MMTQAPKQTKQTKTPQRNTRAPGGATTFVDNRPETTAQRKMQEMVTNSPQVMQHKAMQEMVNNSPRMIQLKAMADSINNSPKMVAQREKAAHFSRGVMQKGGSRNDNNDLSSSVNQPIQLHSYSSGTATKHTVTGSAGKKVNFEATDSNSVKYTKGDPLVQSGGTKTTLPAAWDKVLTDQGNGHNATQLHLVNKDWGGKGGQSDANIFPGSQSLNGHHKVQENLFRAQFDATGAKSDLTYTCTAANTGLSKTFTAPLTGGLAAPEVISDPVVNVKITNDTNNTSLLNQNVVAGNGMQLNDPG